jgi:hypothetical protein
MSEKHSHINVVIGLDNAQSTPTEVQTAMRLLWPYYEVLVKFFPEYATFGAFSSLLTSAAAEGDVPPDIFRKRLMNICDAYDKYYPVNVAMRASGPHKPGKA